MPGPLPKPDRRRRNPPTIPTTALPSQGFAGPYPKPPEWVTLGGAGKAWWYWAWRTPQAAAWSAGDLVVLSTRASLEDDLAALALVRINGVDLAAILDLDSDDAERELGFIFSTMQAMAGDKLRVQKQAVDIDDRLGLTPKGRLALRMSILDAEPAAVRKSPTPTTGRRLRAVDTSATA